MCNRLSVQQFRDGVMLRMCCGLTLATLFVRFFDRYYVATIPKSRFEFLDSFLIFTVWARIYCVHLVLCVRLMLEGLTADTNRCRYPS